MKRRKLSICTAAQMASIIAGTHPQICVSQHCKILTYSGKLNIHTFKSRE